MRYTINVSLDGRHLFATSDHSLSDFESALFTYRRIVERFKVVEGYTVEVSRYENVGQDLTILFQECRPTCEE